jgi:membrane protein YdbS with pleckstrin-like domain
MSDNFAMAVAIIFLIAMILAGIVFPLARYRECRQHSFSVLYCMGQL